MMQTGRKAEFEIEPTVFDYHFGTPAQLAPERRELPDWVRDRRLRFTDEADTDRWETGQIRVAFEADYSASRIPLQRF